MHLQESGEMYLESIYVLLRRNPHVRAIDGRGDLPGQELNPGTLHWGHGILSHWTTR